MKNNNAKKSEQLGLNYSTASHRLKKKILFSFIQRLGEDTCFQCGNIIEDEKYLSVEHKEAWLDKNPELFWNLENIAFSHLGCNVGAVRRAALKCSKGHQYTEDNTYNPPSGGRVCKTCFRDWDRKRWHIKNRALERKIRRQKQRAS